MKRILPLAMALVFAASCRTPDQLGPINAKWNEVAQDGRISPDERAEFDALLKPAGTDLGWLKDLGVALGSIALSVVGVNFQRNRREAALWGSPPPKETA